MKKIILLIAGILLFVGGGVEAKTLGEYFNGRLPSINARQPLAVECGIKNYAGTASQNQELVACLEQGDQALFEKYLNIEIPPEDDLLGAGNNPVTGYQSRTTQFISSSATTIPVVSTKDKAGNAISLSNINSSSTVKVYLNLAPGTSKEEPAVCTGVSPTSWTGCTRGLVFQGSSEVSSSTISTSHNAGTPIIITNISQFYNQYVAVEGSQDIYGDKYFSTGTIYIGNNTTTKNKNIYAYNGDTNLPFFRYNETANRWQVSDDGLNTLNIVSSSATGLSASTTAGIGITDSLIHIIASSTKGLSFGSDGRIQVFTGTDSGIGFDSTGIYVDRFANFVFVSTTLSTTTIQNFMVKNVLGNRLYNGSHISTSTETNYHTHSSGVRTGVGTRGSGTGSFTVTHNLGVVPALLELELYSQRGGNSAGQNYISKGSATSTESQYALFQSWDTGSTAQQAGVTTTVIGNIRKTDAATNDNTAWQLTELGANSFTINVQTDSISSSTFYNWKVYR